MTELEAAAGRWLELLPDRRCDAAALARGAEYFGLGARELNDAAERLPELHDLGYEGVRLLLAAVVDEFAGLFSRDERPLCEVTVPAPPVLIYALQAARPDLRFCSGALYAQTVLRGLFLDRRPLENSGGSRPRCGLNRMRARLMAYPPVKPAGYLLQFGVLCSECVAACSGLSPDTRRLDLILPEGEGFEALAERCCAYLKELESAFGLRLGPEHIRRAAGLSRRLLRAQARIEEQCAMQGAALCGNSLALAQTVQTAAADGAERIVAALELMAEELGQAPRAADTARLYCYYVPYLLPEVDAAFRRHGVRLTGGGAFVRRGTPPCPGLAQATAAWAEAMNIRRPAREECEALADEVQRWGCDGYLTGSFSFDARLGPAQERQLCILTQRYGVSAYRLGADFWSERGAPDIEREIEDICASVMRDVRGRGQLHVRL